MLAAARLTSAQLADPDRLVPIERLVRLMDAAGRELADESFGLHFGDTTDFTPLGVLSYAVLHAPTVGVALRNLDRYDRAHIQGGRVELSVKGKQARLLYRLAVSDRELCRQHAEGAAVLGLRILQRFLGSDWRPARVLFGHRRPRDVSEHERLFRASLRFGQRPAAAESKRGGIEVKAEARSARAG